MAENLYYRQPFIETDSDDSEIDLRDALHLAGRIPSVDESDDDIPYLEQDVVGPKVPEWFQHRKFQYNGRVFIAFLPGFLLVLTIGGEL